MDGFNEGKRNLQRLGCTNRKTCRSRHENYDSSYGAYCAQFFTKILPEARVVEQVYRVLDPNTLHCGKQYRNIVKNALQSGVVNQKGECCLKGYWKEG